MHQIGSCLQPTQGLEDDGRYGLDLALGGCAIPVVLHSDAPALNLDFVEVGARMLGSDGRRGGSDGRVERGGGGGGRGRRGGRPERLPGDEAKLAGIRDGDASQRDSAQLLPRRQAARRACNTREWISGGVRGLRVMNT